MAECNDVRALEYFFNEVNESEIKTVFSIQCIKALSVLINKLQKKAAQQKEICNLINNGNIQLHAEIKFAEQEKNNLIISLNTIKFGNVDLQKEFLLKKEQKCEILKRIELGEKKYEDLWQSSKSRYENIPFVQKCLLGTNKIQLIERNINVLQKESEKLIDHINSKRKAIINTDKKLVIDLTNFLVIERPKIIKMIYDTNNEVYELTKKTDSLKEQTGLKNQLSILKTVDVQNNANKEITLYKMKVDDNLSKSNNEEMEMPKLHILGEDFDNLRVKLEQVKKGDLSNDLCKTTITGRNKTKELECRRKDKHILTNYSNAIAFSTQNKIENDSKRKLIHILDDIELNNSQSRKIISKVDPFKFYEVNFISPEASKIDPLIENKGKESSERKIKIDLNTKREILVPPTQFLDEKKNSQEKKKVTFEVSMETISDEYAEIQHNQSNNITIEDSTNNEDIKNENDNSINDNEQITIKDKILKEHNLDSSPQFVYAKHSIIQKKPEDRVIKSKFFKSKSGDTNESNLKIVERQKTEEVLQEHKAIDSSKINEENVSTEKINQDMRKKETSVAGFLFSHNSQGLLDSLNLSDSTTGFEDGDFPHCLDSSVLLSPKGDVPVEIENDNIHNEPQGVPNFMSGLRKATSLFRWPSVDCKPSTSADKTKENFNFNFNTEEKKKRGELFSMFHK